MTTFIPAKSPTAALALALVQDLQLRLVSRLEAPDDTGRFGPISWLRDEGRHGGGTRLVYAGGDKFNRASVNVSQVHYDDEPERRLGSATAISSIVHPAHPLAPSIHLHISWTEMRDDSGYWRIMADLNPAILDKSDEQKFRAALRGAVGGYFALGTKLGDQYFDIPVLGRHRGVAHFYLEQFRTNDPAADAALARHFGHVMIDAYGNILAEKLLNIKAPTADQRARQLQYHTVYLFQVLTLDRGTTSGLLVHDQNDVGILGSLPAIVDRGLLESWVSKMPKPQDELLRDIVAALPVDGRVEEPQKIALCAAIRRHYAKYPAALELQAKADIIPPTVSNHRSNLKFNH